MSEDTTNLSEEAQSLARVPLFNASSRRAEKLAQEIDQCQLPGRRDDFQRA